MTHYYERDSRGGLLSNLVAGFWLISTKCKEVKGIYCFPSSTAMESATIRVAVCCRGEGQTVMTVSKHPNTHNGRTPSYRIDCSLTGPPTSHIGNPIVLFSGHFSSSIGSRSFLRIFGEMTIIGRADLHKGEYDSLDLDVSLGGMTLNKFFVDVRHYENLFSLANFSSSH